MATAFDARLTGIHVVTEPLVPPLFKPSQVERVKRGLRAAEQRDADRAGALFIRETGSCALPALWRSPFGVLTEQVCHQARFSDLIVLGHERIETPPDICRPLLAEELVLRSGRPVLLLPEEALPEVVTGKIAIVWDGSPQAVRAIHDALPILQRAKDVFLLLVAHPIHFRPDTLERHEDELVDHLKRHGVAPITEQSLHLTEAEWRIVLAYLQQHGIEMLVMGAFGHWTWREVLFGGTTVSLTRKAPIPILLSH